jgi:hypothetical protein
LNLRRIADPQLKVQLRQQSFKPAGVSTRFDSHAHFLSLRRQRSVELLRFLTVLQLPFLELSSICIHKRNLLETRVIICSYNDHCPAPFYPSLFGWLWHHQVYSGLGAGIVMESISLVENWPILADECNRDFSPTDLAGRILRGTISYCALAYRVLAT